MLSAIRKKKAKLMALRTTASKTGIISTVSIRAWPESCCMGMDLRIFISLPSASRDHQSGRNSVRFGLSPHGLRVPHFFLFLVGIFLHQAELIQHTVQVAAADTHLAGCLQFVAAIGPQSGPHQFLLEALQRVMKSADAGVFGNR